jgi:starch phosphorylase
VSFIDLGPAPPGPVTSGRPVEVRAALHLAGLKPDDLRVECVIGRIGASGGLEETEVVLLPNCSVEGDVAVFERQIVPAQTGRLGYAVRVSPNHYEDPLTRPVTSLLKWGTR